jgi:hypothetical protein
VSELWFKGPVGVRRQSGNGAADVPRRFGQSEVGRSDRLTGACPSWIKGSAPRGFRDAEVVEHHF